MKYRKFKVSKARHINGKTVVHTAYPGDTAQAYEV